MVLVKSEEEAIVNLKAEQKTSVAEEVRLEGIAEEFKRIKKLGEDQVEELPVGGDGRALR